MLRSTTQLHLSPELGRFQGKDYRIFDKTWSKSTDIPRCKAPSKWLIFSSKMDLLTRKNMFSQKSLFFPKTYLDSFPNTKYEVLTRKTEWDISKIALKNNDFQHFSLKLVSLWLTKENNEIEGISDWILKLSRSVFRVRHSYLVCMELFTYVFGKNKHFGEKIFFRVKRSIFSEKICHFEEDFHLEPSLDFDQIWSKSCNPYLEMDLTRSSDGVGWSTAALFHLQYHPGQQSRTFRRLWEHSKPLNSSSSFFCSYLHRIGGIHDELTERSDIKY